MYLVTLRRDDGQFVKELLVSSRKAARFHRRVWERRYDETYQVEVIRTVSASEGK